MQTTATDGYAQGRYEIVNFSGKGGEVLRIKHSIKTGDPVVGFLPLLNNKMLVATFNGSILEYCNSTCTRIYQHTSAAMCVGFLNVNNVIVGGMCGDLSNVSLDKQTSYNLSGHASTGHIRSISIDNEYVLSGCDDRTAKLWHGNSLLWTLTGHSTRIWSTALQYPYIVTGTEDGSIFLSKYDPKIPSQGWQIRLPTDSTTHGDICCTALNRFKDCVKVAYGTSSGGMNVYEHHMSTESGDMSSAVFSPTSRLSIQSVKAAYRVVRLITDNTLCVITSCGSLSLIVGSEEHFITSSVKFQSATELAGCEEELIIGTSTGVILNVYIKTAVIQEIDLPQVTSKITTLSYNKYCSAYVVTDAKNNIILGRSHDEITRCFQHDEKSLPTSSVCFEKNGNLIIAVGFKNGTVLCANSSDVTLQRVVVSSNRIVSLVQLDKHTILSASEDGIISKIVLSDNMKTIEGVDSHKTSLKDCLYVLDLSPTESSTGKRHKPQGWLLFHISENTIFGTEIPSGEHLLSIPCKGVSRRTISINPCGVSMVKGARDIIVKKLSPTRNDNYMTDIQILSNRFFLSRDAQGIGRPRNNIKQPDGNNYIVVGDQGDAVLVSSSSIGITQKLVPHHAAGFKCCFQQNNLVIAGGGGDALYVWDISFQPARLVSHVVLSGTSDVSQRVLCVSMCDKTMTIFAGTSDGTIHSVKQPYSQDDVFNNTVVVPQDFGACLSIDIVEELLCVGGSCGRLCLSLVVSNEILLQKVHQSGVNCISATRKSENLYQIATGGDDQSISVMKVSTSGGNLTVIKLFTLPNLVTAAFRSVQFLSDCRYLVALASDQRLLIFVRSSDSDFQFSFHSGIVTRVIRPTALSLCEDQIVVVGQGIEYLTLNEQLSPTT